MTKFDRDFIQFWIKNKYGDLDRFNELPIEMRFGVYQLFGDSVGCELNVINTTIFEYIGKSEQFVSIFEVKRFGIDEDLTYKNTNNELRQQAMQEAINDFKKWYNEQ